MKTGNIASKKHFKFDEYSHGPDWLSFGLKDSDIVEKFFTERIYDLDTDNANFGIVKFVDEHLSIQKYKGPTGLCYSFSCTINTISVPLFEITQFTDQQKEFCSGQWGVIHFFGAYFRSIELKQLSDDFINTINTMFLDCPITRLDYRFDFCSFEEVYNVPSPKQVLPNLRKNKKGKKYYKGEKLQSWEVGNKMNKTIFIRLYNKLDELAGNLKKTYLYSDIDKFKTFFRLEYEFGYKWCAGKTGRDILELFEKAFGTSGLEPSKFKGIMYKPQIALDLSDKIDRLRYIKMFRAMAKNLKKNGLDPHEIIDS